MFQKFFFLGIIIVLLFGVVGCSESGDEGESLAEKVLDSQLTIHIDEGTYILGSGIDGEFSELGIILDGSPVGVFSQSEGGMIIATSSPLSEDFLEGMIGFDDIAGEGGVTVALVVIEQPVHSSGTYAASLLFVHRDGARVVMVGSEALQVDISQFGAVSEVISGSFSGTGEGFSLSEGSAEELKVSLITGEFSVLRGSDIQD